MMHWGTGMGGWGMLAMTMSTLLFWGLIVAGGTMLVRHLVRAGRPGTPAEGPRRILDDRFARGEIDEEEYTHRLAALGRHAV